MSRGYEVLEDTNGTVIHWRRCAVDNCAGLICIGMSTKYCYPHGIEFGDFTEDKFKKDRGDC